MGDAPPTSGIERPDWLPDEYDPDAPLLERLRIMAGIEGGIELHVQGDNGTVEIVDQPQHLTETPRLLRLSCGRAIDDWGWEIVVPKNGYEPYLQNVDPNQSFDAYEATKRTTLKGIDVRMYGVDSDRFDADTDR